MVVFNLSYTAPINEPGVEPVLSQEQVWSCIHRKVRHAEEFVSAIRSTEIFSKSVSELGNLVLERRLTFDPSTHPAGAEYATETCKFYEPCRVDFVSTTGSVITNIVSAGPTRKPEDLLYTYVFQWLHPEIETGSPEAERQEEADWKMTKIAVISTIETMRRLIG
ncbi:hypothetical protein BJ170DRAFT_713397 [Xylariales sp. AK1849]|nr:hypothetical protein BJ170DRAFT_713397 [Xylariales sp. AK1849]